MAAPVVASTSTNSAVASSVTVTKPTGVAVGDLLYAVCIAYDTATFEIDNLSGWTSRHYPTSPANKRIRISTKVADSGDVSASNYTFTTSSGAADVVLAGIARITGVASGSEVVTSEIDEYGGTATTSASFTGTSTPFMADNLVLFLVAAMDQNNGTATTSGYTSTPTRTWTEIFDVGVDFSDRDLSIALASTTAANTTQFTAYSATLSVAKQQIWGSLMIIQQPNSVTTDISHIAITPTVESVTASSVTVTADVGHNTITPTLNGIESEVSSDRTQWTPNNKNTTIWTPNSK